MKTILLPIVSSAIILGWTASAQAGDTICNPGDRLTGKIPDNVIVPDSAGAGVCVIQDATVEGDIKIESGGALIVYGPAKVEGNVQGNGAELVGISGFPGDLVKIRGDLQLKNTESFSGFPFSGYAEFVEIDGNVQYEESSVTMLALRGSVEGDVQAFKNTGGVIIGDNTIEGNLQCKENNPAPTPGIFGLGGSNTVDGNKEDQCAAGLGF